MVKFLFCEHDVLTNSEKCFISYHKKFRLHGMGKSMTKAARELHKLVGRSHEFWMQNRPKYTGRVKCL